MNLALQALVNEHIENINKYHAYRQKRRRISKAKSTRRACPTIPRIRKTVHQNYRALGEYYFRRAYRMSYHTFRQLYSKVKNSLHNTLYKTRTKNAVNGRIPLCSRLGIAICFFAGGDPYDIVQSYGMSHTSVFLSVDAIVETMNSMEEFKIEYPVDHEVQRQIALGFKEKSQVGFEKNLSLFMCSKGHESDGGLLKVWSESTDVETLLCNSFLDSYSTISMHLNNIKRTFMWASQPSIVTILNDVRSLSPML